MRHDCNTVRPVRCVRIASECAHHRHDTRGGSAGDFATQTQKFTVSRRRVQCYSEKINYTTYGQLQWKSKRSP
eukprot:889139-Pyramimonas_sp.AAC.1